MSLVGCERMSKVVCHTRHYS